MTFARVPLVLDCMRAHKYLLHEVEASNALDYVARRHLGEGKLRFDFRRMGGMLATAGGARELSEYNVRDAELVWRLDEKFGYSEAFRAIRDIAGFDDQEAAAFAAPSERKDTGAFVWWRPHMAIVKRRCRELGRSPPQWPTDAVRRLRREVDEARPGAYVKEPVVGHHRNVAEFDFRSLYPSIIRSFNLGYGDSDDPEGDIRPPFGRYTSGRRSVVAGLLDGLAAERDAAKARDAVASTPALRGRIEALKILSNSLYGQLYSTFSPFYHYDSGRNVAVLGQECIRYVVERLELTGFPVIAAHTDGAYVKVPEGGDLPLVGKGLTDELRAHFKDKYGIDFVGQLEFRALYSDLAVYNKTRIAMLEAGRPLPDLELKGYTRGSSPMLQQVVQRKIFEAMFSGGDVAALLASERESLLAGGDHTPLLTWVQVHRTGVNTAPARALAELGRRGVRVARTERIAYLIAGERRFAAHELPGGGTEWCEEGKGGFSTDPQILAPDELERRWGQLVESLDGAPEPPAAKEPRRMTLEDFGG